MSANFMDVLKENNPDSMKKFLLENGKKPKPHCPFYLVEEDEIRKEEVNGRSSEHGKSDE